MAPSLNSDIVVFELPFLERSEPPSPQPDKPEVPPPPVQFVVVALFIYAPPPPAADIDANDVVPPAPAVCPVVQPAPIEIE